MSKVFALFFFVMFSMLKAHAEESLKRFTPPTGIPGACKLAKLAGGKWILADEKTLVFQTVRSVVKSKANGNFSNFKVQGTWYAARNECLKDLPTGDAGRAIELQNNAKYFIDLRLQKALMLGSNMGPSSGSISSTEIIPAQNAYTTGVGFGGRFGYLWKNNKYFILDVSIISGSQTLTYTGLYNGSVSNSESMMSLNLGLQFPIFRDIFWGLKPYAAGMVGYTKLSGTVSGTINSEAIAISYSWSGVDIALETGVAKEISNHWDALFSLGLNLLSTSPAVSQPANNTSQAITLVPPRGYSNLASTLAARYLF